MEERKGGSDDEESEEEPDESLQGDRVEVDGRVYIVAEVADEGYDGEEEDDSFIRAAEFDGGWGGGGGGGKGGGGGGGGGGGHAAGRAPTHTHTHTHNDHPCQLEVPHRDVQILVVKMSPTHSLARVQDVAAYSEPLVSLLGAVLLFGAV